MQISFSWPPSGCKFNSVSRQPDANCILLAAMQYKIPSLHAASDQPNEMHPAGGKLNAILQK
jgi:hypothetical protein